MAVAALLAGLVAIGVGATLSHGSLAGQGEERASDLQATDPLPSHIRQGMSLASFGKNTLRLPTTIAQLDAMQDAGIDWVAVVPHWFQANETTSNIHRTSETASDTSVREFIEAAHDRGMSVFLKPHLDLSNGEWRAYIDPTNKTTWFANYTAMLSIYADIAQDTGVEIMSMGTELATLAEENTNYVRWRNLITALRGIYDGKLTYASNYFWEGTDQPGYQGVSFWKDLDYVGIDAYYEVGGVGTGAGPDACLHLGGPRSIKNPTVASMVNRWDFHLDNIEGWRAAQPSPVSSKGILFTEVGYGSFDGSASCPWAYPELCSETGIQVSNTDQANGYRALFDGVRNRSWLAGVFIWWWDNPSTSDWKAQADETDWNNYPCYYTPRGKSALTVLGRAYAGPSPTY